MNGAVICVSASSGKGFRVFAPHCNVTTIETTIVRRNCMRHVIVISPGNSRPCGHRNSDGTKSHIHYAHRIGSWCRIIITTGIITIAFATGNNYNRRNQQQQNAEVNHSIFHEK